MLKFGPTGFDPDFFSNPDNLNVAETLNSATWFNAFATDGEAGVPAVTVDSPLTGLSLPLDGEVLDVLFADDGDSGDGAENGDKPAPLFEAGISADAADFGIASADVFEPGHQAFTAIQISADDVNGFRVDELPINAIPFAADGEPGAGDTPADSGLIFLDFAADARGGNGGGNGSGSEDPNVLSEYISGDLGGFNIEIDFKGSWTVDLQSAFIDASGLISDLIVGDIADVFFRGKVIDDIRIDAKLSDIDGEGGILGRAGPTAIHTDGYLPATAVMEFDIADAANFNTMPSGSEGTL